MIRILIYIIVCSVKTDMKRQIEWIKHSTKKSGANSKTEATTYGLHAVGPGSIAKNGPGQQPADYMK